MAFIIKARLTNAALEYYRNVTENISLEQTATNIVLCNTGTLAANVTLSFTRVGGDIAAGYILFETAIPAKGFLELKNRVVNPETTIKAYASVNDAVVFSCDILNDTGEYEVVVPN